MRKEIKGTRLSPYKLSQVINEFVFNTPARVCAEKLHLHRNTVNLWYGKMREGISNLPDPEPFSGEVEIDESYFGKKKTGQGRAGTVQGQVAVFGLRERKSGRVIACVVAGVSAKHLIPLIEKHVLKGSTIYSDGFGAYYHLGKLGYHHRVVYHEYTFVDQHKVHTNGIESFWAYTKHLLSTRKGLSYKSYPKHIKEAQKRHNTFSNKKLRLLLRRILQNNE